MTGLTNSVTRVSDRKQRPNYRVSGVEYVIIMCAGMVRQTSTSMKNAIVSFTGNVVNR
jgi:hypothetical protein